MTKKLIFLSDNKSYEYFVLKRIILQLKMEMIVLKRYIKNNLGSINLFNDKQLININDYLAYFISDNFSFAIINNDLELSIKFHYYYISILFLRLNIYFDEDIVIFVEDINDFIEALILGRYLKNHNYKHKILLIGPFLKEKKFNEEEFNVIFNCIDLMSPCIDYSKFLNDLLKCSLDRNNGLFSKSDVVNFYEYTEEKYDEYANSLFEIGDIDEYDYESFFPIKISSSCYYRKCIFCYESFFSWKIHTKKIDILVSEIEYLYHNFGVCKIKFVDNYINENYLILLAKKLIENNIKIKWICATRIGNKLCSNEITKLLSNSGCRKLFIGVESYSNRLLADFNKGIKKEQIIPMLTSLKEANILTHVSFMFGYIIESEVDVNETINFIKNNCRLIDYYEFNLYVHESWRLFPEIFNRLLIPTVEKLRNEYCKKGMMTK